MVINRWSNGRFLPSAVYIGFLLFVLAKRRAEQLFYSALEGRRGGWLPRRPKCRHLFLPSVAPPRRPLCAVPTRPARCVSGFWTRQVSWLAALLSSEAEKRFSFCRHLRSDPDVLGTLVNFSDSGGDGILRSLFHFHAGMPLCRVASVATPRFHRLRALWTTQLWLRIGSRFFLKSSCALQV